MLEHSIIGLAWIALSLMLLGMSKGGFPIGSVALPIMILIWPNQTEAARTAVAFLLPMLCAMDVFALLFYRKHILWRPLLPLFPGMLAGVAVASLLFVSRDSAIIHVSDRGVKFCVGMIGLLFCLYQATKRWILQQLESKRESRPWVGTSFGFAAGVTSTIAHAAGPVLQMYLLPKHLPKKQFAGTNAAFFFVLNLVKLLPFALLGRIEKPNLVLGAAMLPVIPVGVAIGYFLVHHMKPKHYVAFIYIVLFVTSVMLIARAVSIR